MSRVATLATLGLVLGGALLLAWLNLGTAPGSASMSSAPSGLTRRISA